MKFAIVTSFFEGDKYIKDYLSFIRENTVNMSSMDELFVILVNDSPWIDLLELVENAMLPQDLKRFECHVLTNEENRGIHQSRISGLEMAESLGAEYVMFLDQDDYLSEDAIKVFSETIENTTADIYISNAILEQKDWSDKWIRTSYHSKVVWDKKTYLKIGTQIISPGQCMIKVTSIPGTWQDHTLTQNGADDYYLWLLMMGEKATHIYIDKPLYTHKYTGENISSDTEATDRSVYAFIPHLRKFGSVSKKECNLLVRMIDYKSNFRRGGMFKKALFTLLNVDLFLSNLVYKSRTKTGLGFNR